MSRSLLSLFELDRAALAAFDAELRGILAEDDREALVLLLGFGGTFADRARAVTRAVDLFLVPETEPANAGLYASLRRVAKKRALTHAWTSESPALEGRLREYDLIREDPELASRVDALLDARRVPWFLRRPGGTAGVLGSTDREALSDALLALAARDEVPPEVGKLADALGVLDGDVLCHDGLV